MEIFFVTGGTGFIGQSLLRELAARPETEAIWSLYRSTVPFTHKKIHWVKGDMDHLPALPAGTVPAKVIHAAALQNRNRSQKQIYQENVRWTENIIAFAKAHKAGEIDFFSSINVRLKHSGAYAVSKRRCELLVKNSGIPYKILRPALVYGAGENGLTSLVNYVRRLPAVPVFGNGKAEEQPVYVDDLAKLAACYILDAEGAAVQEFCGPEPMAYDTMVKSIAAAIGKKGRILHLPFLPFYYALHLIEKLGLALPISSEQIAHIAEDLSTDMAPVCRLYHVELTDFSRTVKQIYS